jgi:hypothetical protein
MFQEIISSIESLSVEDQDYLFELIRYRRAKNDRSVVLETSNSEAHHHKVNDLSVLNFDFNAPPIWDVAARLSAKVPDDEWVKLPKDLAQNFDQYQEG